MSRQYIIDKIQENTLRARILGKYHSKMMHRYSRLCFVVRAVSFLAATLAFACAAFGVSGAWMMAASFITLLAVAVPVVTEAEETVIGYSKARQR